MNVPFFKIEDVCKTIENVVKDREGIQISLFSQYDLLHMNFKILIFYELNGQSVMESFILNHDNLYNELNLEQVKLISNFVDKIINKKKKKSETKVENKKIEYKQIRKVKYKPLRCECCGGTIKDNICEYCRTEYAVF